MGGCGLHVSENYMWATYEPDWCTTGDSLDGAESVTDTERNFTRQYSRNSQGDVGGFFGGHLKALCFKEALVERHVWQKVGRGCRYGDRNFRLGKGSERHEEGGCDG